MPVAALAGPVIGGIGSIVGGVMGASAAKKAADAQAKAAQAAAANSVASANNATDYGNQMFNYQRAINNPWLGMGQAAITNVGQRLGLNAPSSTIGPNVNAGMLSLPGGTPNASPVNPGAPQIIPPAQKMRGGGFIQGPGSETSDSVPIMASKGEAIVKASAVKRPGVAQLIMHLNRGGNIGGTHFAQGGMVTNPDPNAPPAITQPFAGQNPSTIADPTVRTIVGAAQGGVNMNSLPGGQTANNQQPGLMQSLNIGYNGQIPGAPGYAGSSATVAPSSGFSGTQAMKGATANPATQGGVMTPAPTASGTDTSLSTPASLGGFTANNSPGEAIAQPPGSLGLMTPNPASDPASAATASGAGAMTPAGGDGSSAQPFNPLSYGNLTQGYDQQFNNPTNVTEQNDPGYQFRLQQGQQALERSAAARGGLLTGGTAKDLADYQQGAASQEYGNVYNRALQNYTTNRGTFYTNQDNLYNRLMGVSGAGQNAANSLTGAGTNSANNISGVDMNSANQVGQDLTNAGTARASGYVGANNALSGILPGIGQSASLYDILRNRGGAPAPAPQPYTPYNVADYANPFGD